MVNQGRCWMVKSSWWQFNRTHPVVLLLISEKILKFQSNITYMLNQKFSWSIYYLLSDLLQYTKRRSLFVIILSVDKITPCSTESEWIRSFWHEASCQQTDCTTAIWAETLHVGLWQTLSEQLNRCTSDFAVRRTTRLKFKSSVIFLWERDL